MGAEECNLLAFTNDFDTVGTSALEMVSSELGFDTNIAISNHCSSSVEITWVSVFTTIVCSKRTHSFGQVFFFFFLNFGSVFNCNGQCSDSALGGAVRDPCRKFAAGISPEKKCPSVSTDLIFLVTGILMCQFFPPISTPL